MNTLSMHSKRYPGIIITTNSMILDDSTCRIVLENIYKLGTGTRAVARSRNKAKRGDKGVRETHCMPMGIYLETESRISERAYQKGKRLRAHGYIIFGHNTKAVSFAGAHSTVGKTQTQAIGTQISATQSQLPHNLCPHNQ